MRQKYAKLQVLLMHNADKKTCKLFNKYLSMTSAAKDCRRVTASTIISDNRWPSFAHFIHRPVCISCARSLQKIIKNRTRKNPLFTYTPKPTCQ